MGSQCGKRIPKSGPRLRELFLALLVCLLVFSGHEAFGHGGSSEIFPPVELNGKLVTLEVAASQDDTDDDAEQISISFLDFDSKITLRDVIFHIKAERGNQFLFEQEFRADHGFLVFKFISGDADPVMLEETGGNVFGSLLGLDSRKINVTGPRLAEGGLYMFDVSVLAVDGYSERLEVPLVYDAGISIPQTVRHEISHPDYGLQTIQTITYYDELSDFNYDIDSKEISFSMPFDWTVENIEKTTVVHQELVIPKEFGDLLVSGFSMYINGIKLSDSIVSIDDYVPKTRTVHFIVNQQELLNILKDNKQKGINFLVKPWEKTRLGAVTENGQFRIYVSWFPERLESDSEAVFSFDITDVFLKDKPVAVNYDFSVTYDQRVIFEQNGISTDSKEMHNTAEFVIPSEVSGIVHLNFNNLDYNSRGAVSVPVIVNSMVPDQVSIPSWVKNSAGWWSDGTINDETFLQGIGFLIKNDIIQIPQMQQAKAAQEIPSWIKSSAGWWSDGTINDETFVNSLQFLIERGIIPV